MRMRVPLRKLLVPVGTLLQVVSAIFTLRRLAFVNTLFRSTLLSTAEVRPASAVIASHMERRAPSFAELERFGDDQLMQCLQDGFDDALAVLFDRYHRLVLSIALKIVRDLGEAEDITQNVFLEIFQSVAKFDPAKGSTKTWVLQYAYHRSINRRQHLTARKFYDQEDIDDVGTALSDGSFPLGQLTRTELKGLLQGGLASLSASQRRVIELSVYYGFSMEEIAKKMSETVWSVRHQYYRGLLKLRDYVTDSHEVKKAACNE
jgi:RNA polymerase sigma-70 factor, ECF subfamily